MDYYRWVTPFHSYPWKKRMEIRNCLAAIEVEERKKEIEEQENELKEKEEKLKQKERKKEIEEKEKS